MFGVSPRLMCYALLVEARLCIANSSDALLVEARLCVANSSDALLVEARLCVALCLCC